MSRHAELARVRTTGNASRVLRRGTIVRDLAVWDALEAAGAVVIGTPGGAIRYRRANGRGFARLAPDAVLLLDAAGAASSIVPGDYFHQHYTLDAEGSDNA